MSIPKIKGLTCVTTIRKKTKLTLLFTYPKDLHFYLFFIFQACEDTNCLQCDTDANICADCADGFYVDGEDACSGKSIGFIGVKILWSSH